jgi:hypothetical protein
MFKKLSLLVILGVLSSCTNKTTTQCTDKPKEQWQDETEFQASLEDSGYRINRFKVTDGNCYEIYGFNSEDQKVEVYFSPVDGSVVKEEIEE